MSSFIDPFSAEAVQRALVISWIGGTLLVSVSLLLLRTGRVSAGMSSQLILLSMLSFLALPFAAYRPVSSSSASASGWEQTHFSLEAAGKFPGAEHHHAPAREGMGSDHPLLWIWGIGAGLALISLARRVVRTVRLTHGSVPLGGPWLAALEKTRKRLGVTRDIRLATHSEVESPLAWGPPRALVVLPSKMASASVASSGGDLTLMHEVAHIERGDSLTSLFADLICVLVWFHPLVWLARRRLSLHQEQAADSRVVSAGALPSDYSAHLLSLFREQRRWETAGVHRIDGEGAIGARIRSILDIDRDHRAPGAWTRRWVGASFLGVFAMVAAVGQESPKAMTAESLRAALHPGFEDEMRERHVAGAAIAVVHDGEIVYQDAWGRPDVLLDDRVDAEKTIFRIGSVTKVLTGAAVMQCVDRGLLDLDTDVNEYLEAFQVEEAFGEPVRVWHLLTHTAGFDQLGYGRHVRSLDEVLPLEEFLADSLVRIRPPGQLSCYDTYAITLAGYLVEVVSGLGYEEYLKQNFFEPLGMNRSFIAVPDEFRDDIAVGYEYRGQWIPQRWEFMNTGPASTVNSTVADMARFVAMLLEGGTYEGKRLLSEEAVQAMLRKQFSNHPDQPGYGLTFFEDRSQGVDAFSHGGSMTGYASFMYLVPEEGLGFFMAYNQESGALSTTALEAITKEAFGSQGARPVLPRVKGVDLSRFTGIYASNMYNHTRPERGGWAARPFEITLDGDRILFRDRLCEPVGELTLQTPDGVLLTFVEDPAGEIDHLVVQQSVYERMSP